MSALSNQLYQQMLQDAEKWIHAHMRDNDIQSVRRLLTKQLLPALTVLIDGHTGRRMDAASITAVGTMIGVAALCEMGDRVAAELGWTGEEAD